MDCRVLFCVIIIASSPSISFGMSTSSVREKPVSVSYKNAQVWRTQLRNQKDFQMVQEFDDRGRISLWHMSNKHADYLVLNKNRVKVSRKLEKNQLKHTVLMPDVQRRIDATKIEEDIPWTDSSLRIGHRLNFQSYPSVEIINEYLDYLKDNYVSILHVRTIGHSVENRPIRMVHVTDGNPSNKAIVLLGGQHAREWVGITSVLYVLNSIATMFDDQPNYIRRRDWYIIPLLNPDGYYYTRTTDRLWRKNRSNNCNSKCPGVDLNRNYPKHWLVTSLTHHNECSQQYAGPYAMSEPEAFALHKMMISIKPKTPSVIADFHSFGHMILYPWGIKNKVSPHEEILRSTAESMASEIYKTTHIEYKFGTPREVIYAASGSALDWFHSKGVCLAYSFEAQDNGTYGFLLPPERIEVSGIEMFAAVRILAEAVDSADASCTSTNYTDFLNLELRGEIMWNSK